MQCIDDVGVGKRLGKLREEKGIKKLVATVELETSTANYSRLEHGKGHISVEVLHRACHYYNTTAEYILFGEENVCESIVFEKLERYPEKFARRMLKILSCLLLQEDDENSRETSVYKIFMGGLLERLPSQESTAIPAVLEYEKNIRKVSENTMIKELGITRFIWTNIMHGKEIRDIRIPLTIADKYGYDLNFLINNKISSNMFFDELLSQKKPETQRRIMQIFDSILGVYREESLLR